ncbi:MAG: YncE family protein, partial [Candidatus Eiseniibacteriota bacterium]
MRRVLRMPVLGLLLAVPAAAITVDQFESGHVHPVEISPDGTKLFVVHTAGNELAVFDLTGTAGPVRIGKVAVGYEPVTVRARSNNEAWVVCHISDAVNVVDVSQMTVVRTIRTGDEPTDVAFVEAQNRAFVCLSQLDTIAAYDLTNLTLPPTDIPLLHSDPRSRALSTDGAKLYVAAHDNPNQTSVVGGEGVLAGGGAPPP